MDELRFVRREETSLIVATDTGTEFRLVVDDTVLAELRHLSRRERSDVKIRPREIQSLIRAGKSRAQVAKETGLDESDIERYAEPVLAERRYILERAKAIAVRADAHDEDEQNFGAVIGARLLALGAEAPEWSSWKEDEGGWMIGLEFISHDTAHRAVWSFDHRKGTLAPLNSDATNLSKQGEVGDRLIPKLRAVDDGELRGRFDSGAFDREEMTEGVSVGVTEEQPTLPTAETDTTTATEPVESTRSDTDAPDSDAEYERRREIDHRAVKTTAQPGDDLSQTADLLDALRKRRGERERSTQTETPADPALAPSPPAASPEPVTPVADRTQAPHPAEPASPQGESESTPRPRSIWSAGGVSREAGAKSERRIPSFLREEDDDDTPAPVEPLAETTKATPKPEPRKGRASIPSWDDILFGTRSDEDPV